LQVALSCRPACGPGRHGIGGQIGGTNTFINAAGATFDDQNTANYNIVGESGTPVFDNVGLFDKTAASGTSTTAISAAFNNTGTLEIDAGTIDLAGGGASSGGFTGAGTLEFGGGTTTLAAGSSITTPNVIFAGMAKVAADICLERDRGSQTPCWRGESAANSSLKCQIPC
jgi:hypothetical protein